MIPARLPLSDAPPILNRMIDKVLSYKPKPKTKSRKKKTCSTQEAKEKGLMYIIPKKLPSDCCDGRNARGNFGATSLQRANAISKSADAEYQSRRKGWIRRGS